MHGTNGFNIHNVSMYLVPTMFCVLSVIQKDVVFCSFRFDGVYAHWTVYMYIVHCVQSLLCLCLQLNVQVCTCECMQVLLLSILRLCYGLNLIKSISSKPNEVVTIRNAKAKKTKFRPKKKNECKEYSKQ